MSHILRVLRVSGEGVYMGDEVGAWMSRFLGKDGFKVYFMSPQHRGRSLRDDSRWDDCTQPGEEVSQSSHPTV